MSPRDVPKSKPRPQIMRLAHAMEARLQANEYKGGWEYELPDYLFRRLREETNELGSAYTADSTDEEVLREAADVANFAMMLADNFYDLRRYGRLRGRSGASREQGGRGNGSE